MKDEPGKTKVTVTSLDNVDPQLQEVTTEPPKERSACFRYKGATSNLISLYMCPLFVFLVSLPFLSIAFFFLLYIYFFFFLFFLSFFLFHILFNFSYLALSLIIVHIQWSKKKSRWKLSMIMRHRQHQKFLPKRKKF